MAAVLNYRKAKEMGYDDVVYVNRHSHILEGTPPLPPLHRKELCVTRTAFYLFLFPSGPTWNFFAVREGKIILPRNELILTGITAQCVEQTARQLGILVFLSCNEGA